jgi:hypothetical protein
MSLGNVIDVIYKKYRCVEEEVNKADVILTTTYNACELILRSPIWKQYIEKNNSPDTNKIWKQYSDSFTKYGAIIPDSTLFLARVGVVSEKIKTNSPLSEEDINAVIALAKTLNIKLLGKRKPTPQQLAALLNKIDETIQTTGMRSSTVTILSIDPLVRSVFRTFLKFYLSNTCYLSRDDINIREQFKEAMRLYGENDVFGNMTIGDGYISDLVDDNLAETFPDLYKNSENKKSDSQLGEDLVPLDSTLWENRPEFPKYAMIWILRKSDLLVTNFIAARRGFDTVKGTPDRDVYGQLICSNRNIRSSGLGKLLLISTILMAYQYKVNYIFIQAFQGITGVQAPLYNRMGFNFYFDEELLKRKTAFYQWSMVDESDLDSAHEKYLNKTLDKSKYPNKFQHLSYLQPMFLYVRGYETQYACDCLVKSGYDYHTRSSGSMGKGIKKWMWDIPTRLAGYGTKSGKETQEILETADQDDRLPDGSECKEDRNCLSDYCVAGRCTPYPYGEVRRDKYIPPKNTFMRDFDRTLKKRGLNPQQDKEYTEARNERELELLAMAEENHLKKEEIRKIREEQDALRAWYDLLSLKAQDEKVSKAEEEAFLKRLKEYQALTKTQKYKEIAKYLLRGISDPITKKLF